MRQFEKISVFCRLLPVLLLLPIPASSQQKAESISSILSERNVSDFSRRRAETVNQLADIERITKANAIARARKLNLPIRIEHPGGRVQELIAFEVGKPLYAITLNREAAITTHAARARSLFDIDGAGFTVGVWDAGAIRETHEAFEGRITIRDSSDFDNHATHIGGTIGADGSNLRAHGMSPAVFI